MDSPHQSQQAVVVADVGATLIRVGTNRSLEPVEQQLTGEAENAALSLAEMIARVAVSSGLTVAVVGAPGLVSLEGAIGPALYSPLRQLDLRGQLHALVPSLEQIEVLNDASLITLGVVESLGAMHSRSHLHIATGSAIGGALVFDGEVLRGGHGYAGEIGHVPAGIGTLRCPCGAHDCADLYASGWSLERDLGHGWWNRTTADDVVQRLELAAQALARAIAICHMLVDLKTFSLSGNLIRTAPWIGPAIAGQLETTPGLEYVDVSQADHWNLATSGARALVSVNHLTTER